MMLAHSSDLISKLRWTVVISLDAQGKHQIKQMSTTTEAKEASVLQLLVCRLIAQSAVPSAITKPLLSMLE